MEKNNLHMAAKFSAIAKAIPDSLCIIQGARRYTYQEIDLRSNALADIFLQSNIKRGDRVAVMERNSTEYVESYIAAQKLACIPCNVNYKYKEDELLYLLEDSSASILVINEDFLEILNKIELPACLKKVVVIGPSAQTKFKESNYLSYQWAIEKGSRLAPQLPWPAPNNGDLLFLLYTGGTTGYPKGAMWDGTFFEQNYKLLVPAIRSLLPKLSEAPTELFSHRSGQDNLLTSFLKSGVFRWLIGHKWVQERVGDLAEKAMRERYAGELDVAVKRIKVMRKFPNNTLISCPLMHGTGWLSASICLGGGDTLVLLESKSFDAAELLRTVEKERIKTVIIVGDAFAIPILHELEKNTYDTSSLVVMNSSGVVWSPRVKKGLLEHIPQLVVLDSLGASEALSRAEPMIGSDSDIQPMKFKLAEHVRVFDEHDEEVLPGSNTVGQLAVSGLITRGYWNDEEKTKKTYRTIRGVRYAIFGDMCKVEKDGSLILLGRGSGCINTGGEKVYPEEVENVIKKLHEVSDCCIVGIDDERWGKAIVGIVEARENCKISTDHLLEHCGEHLANYKKPKHLWVVKKVPRKENGKMDYSGAMAMIEKLDKGEIA